MPWKEIKPMDQKVKMISDWVERDDNVTALARKYDLSRKTVYKWVTRYEAEGIDGLKDQSRAPKHCPNKTPDDVINILVREKYKHRRWGPKKIIALLEDRDPDREWPASSTVGEWFKKLGLSRRRRLRKKVPPYTEPFLKCHSPNDIWSADYKGQFRTDDNRVCYPLTITDNKSRYLLACQGLSGPRHDETKEVFKATFMEYGMPYAIRVDNGLPFASRNVTGLSRLSIWWIKLGIIPERIAKGKPEQNGRHERMHRTLKECAINPPAMTMREQQERFDMFRIEYNEERPHESLGQKPPASIYKRSDREYKENLFRPEYDSSFSVRRVWHKGQIRFKGVYYYLSELLCSELIGLKEINDGLWQINFGFQPISILNLHTKRLEPFEKEHV